MKYLSHYRSPLGGITLSSDGERLTGSWFDNEKYSNEFIAGNIEEKELDIFDDARRWLDVYFQGRDPGFLPDISLKDLTPFRREVCEIMMTIPFGNTMTYGQIAEIIGKKRGIEKMSSQAVGGAVGHNPISLIIPCHRVVGTGGSLTGYGGGIHRKEKLLILEGVDMSRFFIPERGTAL